MVRRVLLLLLLLPLVTCGSADANASNGSVDVTPAPFAPPLRGNASAVSDLLERVLPGSVSHFDLAIDPNVCGGEVCFQLEDGAAGRVHVSATSASELSAGVGHYLRQWCNMTMGWARGGGSHFFIPATWPTIGPKPVTIKRLVRWSFAENVCTSSYTLVWHSWREWEEFLDWAALWGLNMLPALTGQEEVQYKTLRSFGLDDFTVRSWFNGPALLTWSRGQNSHGNSVLGPLPRSWMKARWNLQRNITARMRDLGIAGQLPGFQGNVPWALAAVLKDSNITQGEGQGNGTGWMDSRDPNFGRIADVWMTNLLNDFGTVGNVYQMDGFFAPTSWGAAPAGATPAKDSEAFDLVGDLPPCKWSSHANAYVPGCPSEGCTRFKDVDEAKQACIRTRDCNGITIEDGEAQLRQGPGLKSYHGDFSWIIDNNFECRRFAPDPDWLGRGKAAYAALAKHDPNATWVWQGWAIYVAHWDPPTPDSLSQLSGFIKAAPPGKFLLLDMSGNGDGEWKNWGLGTWDTPFVWTSLNNFGGNDGIKGDLERASRIPFDALPPFAKPVPPSAFGVAGTGFTPEGFDQNPAYFELIQEAPWRTAPVSNMTAWLVDRALRRYGLTEYNDDVAQAWALLGQSSYAVDLGVHDDTGVALLPGTNHNDWETPCCSKPTTTLCQTWHSWGRLISAGQSGAIDLAIVPFRYDLINTGREVLAKIATAYSIEFHTAISGKLIAKDLNETGTRYVELLHDLDTLVSTETGFMLGPWLRDARAWGEGASDCNDTMLGNMSCPDFYEWNARTQITTWYPTPPNSTVPPVRDADYARKHWSPLIRDYYAARVQGILDVALRDAMAGKPSLDQQAVNLFRAQLAFNWTTSTSPYPLDPTPNYVGLSATMRGKYAHLFTPTCG